MAEPIVVGSTAEILALPPDTVAIKGDGLTVQDVVALTSLPGLSVEVM